MSAGQSVYPATTPYLITCYNVTTCRWDNRYELMKSGGFDRFHYAINIYSMSVGQSVQSVFSPTFVACVLIRHPCRITSPRREP